MPFYQQNWLQKSLKPKSSKHSRQTAVAAIFSRGQTRASFSGTSNNLSASYKAADDPLMYSLLQSAAAPDPHRKTTPSFHEEKLMNRDSGTDSPTCNNYEEQQILNLINTLGTEHQQLTKGEMQTRDVSGWQPGEAANRQQSEAANRQQSEAVNQMSPRMLTTANHKAHLAVSHISRVCILSVASEP